MTLLFSDGFESYELGGDRTALESTYTYSKTAGGYGLNVSDVSVLGTGRVTGKCVSASSTHSAENIDIALGHEIDVASLSSSSTWIVGYAMRCAASTFQSPYSYNASPRIGLIQFQDSDGVPMVSVFTRSVSNITAVTGDMRSVPVGSKLGSSDKSLLASVWHYVEFKITFSPTAGSVVVRVDGQEALNITGANTSGKELAGRVLETSPTKLVVGCTADGVPVWIDDLYVCDGSGSTNNDFLGDVGNRRLYPTANGTTNQFTASGGGLNYTYVDEEDVDDDATFVESSTAGDNDLYAISDPAVTPTDIVAFNVVVVAKSDDGGAKTGRNMILSGSTEGLGDIYSLSADYASYRALFPVDPATGTAWTSSGINNVEIGVEVVA